jgi:hypothetical protein
MRDVTMGGSAQRQRDRPKQTGKPYASTQLPELPVFMQQPQRQRDLTIQHTDQITMQMPKPMQTTIQKPKVPPEIILSNIQPPPIVDPRIHKPKIPLIGFGGGSGTSLTSQREGLHTRLKVIKHNIADIQKLI